MFPGAVYKFTYLLTYVWCHLFLKTNLPITNGNRRAAEMTSTTVGDRWFAVAAANPRYCYRNPHPGHLPRMPRLDLSPTSTRPMCVCKYVASSRFSFNHVSFCREIQPRRVIHSLERLLVDAADKLSAVRPTDRRGCCKHSRECFIVLLDMKQNNVAQAVLPSCSFFSVAQMFRSRNTFTSLMIIRLFLSDA